VGGPILLGGQKELFHAQVVVVVVVVVGPGHYYDQ